LVYVIEILSISNKQIINAYKKDHLGVEYGGLYDFSSIYEAVNAIRNKCKFQGIIKVLKDGNLIGVIDGSI
jgi:hypothetical protein